MAASSQVKDLQEAVVCSICLDHFNEPVILKCGHNFCRACITQRWDESKTSPPYSCPQCRQAFPDRELQPNRQLRNAAEITKTFPEPRGMRRCEQHKEPFQLFCEVAQTPICLVCRGSRSHRDHRVIPSEEDAPGYKDQIQSRLESLEKERETILLWKSEGENESQVLLNQLKTERQKIMSEFQRLRQFLKEHKQLLLAQLEELNKEIEKRRDEYIAKLSEEISFFNLLISEMELKCQLPASEFLQGIKDTLSRCEREKFQNPEAFSSELKWRIFESSQNFAVLETKVKKFKETLSSRQHPDKANVTLDPATAHPRLVLAADRRRVTLGRARQDLPDTPERFDTAPCVLGCEGFTAGRHCWEVEVEVRDGQCWAVGVARESVRRKGKISPSPEQGIWALEGTWRECWAFTSSKPGIRLSLYQTPRRIRVHLDYEGGWVAFSNARDGDRIVVFPPASFAGERLRPFFGFGCRSPDYQEGSRDWFGSRPWFANWDWLRSASDYWYSGARLTLCP